MCYGLCNLDEWKSNGKDTVALKVNFSNCFTELSTATSTTKNADITITCNLQVSENCSKFSEIVTSKFKTKQNGIGTNFIFSQNLGEK